MSRTLRFAVTSAYPLRVCPVIAAAGIHPKLPAARPRGVLQEPQLCAGPAIPGLCCKGLLIRSTREQPVFVRPFMHQFKSPNHPRIIKHAFCQCLIENIEAETAHQYMRINRLAEEIPVRFAGRVCRLDKAFTQLFKLLDRPASGRHRNTKPCEGLSVDPEQVRCNVARKRILSAVNQ